MKIVIPVLGMLTLLSVPILSRDIEVSDTETQPQVIAIYPSSDSLPSNLLRLYVHFSKPMKPIGNLENIKLRDESGNEVIGAIFDNAFELWNNEQTQLTLLLDPSRVKTGLRANEERGRALNEGKMYKLVVGELEDVDGLSTDPFVKSIAVCEEDRRYPNPELWTIETPKAGSREPLIIEFPEMLDRLSLLHRVRLGDTDGRRLPGSIVIANHETEWRFYPDENWTSSDHIIYIHSRLEDPAGNNLNGLFDDKPKALKYKDKIETITVRIAQ